MFIKTNIFAVGAALIFCVFFSWPAYGRDSRCRNSDDILEREHSMWLNETALGQRRLVSCIDEAWAFFETQERVKSAEFVAIASSNLVAALKFNPASFMKIMDQHPELLNKWLKNVEFDIFTWHEEPPCALEPQIEDIRLAIERANKSAGESVSFRKIRDRFKALKCNQIE